MTTQQILQGVHDWTNGKIVYDISVAHPDGQGKPTPYADLTAALGTGGANIPEELRKGGMSVKFIKGSAQSSDNKYVQARCMAQNFTTDVAQWQGVDDEPAANSENLVKSGGVYRQLYDKNITINIASGNPNIITGKTISTQGVVSNYATYYITKPLFVSAGTEVEYKIYSLAAGYLCKANSIDDAGPYTVIESGNVQSTVRTYTPEKDCLLVLCGQTSSGGYIKIKAEDGSITKLEKVLNATNTELNTTNTNLESLSETVENGIGDTYNLKNIDSVFSGVSKDDDGNYVLSVYALGRKSISVSGLNAAQLKLKIKFSDIAASSSLTVKANDITIGTISYSSATDYTEFSFNIPVGSTWIVFTYGSGGDTLIHIKAVQVVTETYKDYPIVPYKSFVDFSARGILDKVVPEFTEDIEALESELNISYSKDEFTLITPYYVKYSDGSVVRGSSGQQMFVMDNLDKLGAKSLYVKIKNIYTSEACIAFYENSTYLKSSSITGRNAVFDEIIQVPSNATKVRIVNYPTQLATPDVILYCSLKNTVLENKSKIDEFGNFVNGSSILSLNPKSEYQNRIIQASAKYKNGQDTSIPTPIKFLWFSDIHADSDNLKRLIEFKEAYNTYIDDILSTGDNIASHFEDSYTWWSENGGDNILNVLGNHDGWTTIPPSTQEDVEGGYQGSALMVVKPLLCYNKFFAPYISNWNVVQPDDAAELGKCYYYKDYTYNNNVTLRLVVLDCMHYNIYSDLDGQGNSIQMAWFENVLSDANTNHIPVMVAAHYKAYSSFTRVNCSFNSYDYASEDTMPLAKEKVDNFIAGGGEFVCWLHGHDHFDLTTTMGTHSFLSLGIETAKCPDVWEDSLRVENTKSQDCFNYISIDTREKLVKIVRIGDDYNRYLQHKGVLVYRYADYNGKQKGLVLCE